MTLDPGFNKIQSISDSELTGSDPSISPRSSTGVFCPADSVKSKPSLAPGRNSFSDDLLDDHSSSKDDETRSIGERLVLEAARAQCKFRAVQAERRLDDAEMTTGVVHNSMRQQELPFSDTSPLSFRQRHWASMQQAWVGFEVETQVHRA
ncbi:hypothetical protein HYDPIDRAFT_33925 [Hydnomerulius pinastri MD-312]|uniref:Uncharacterized protein n=1 Tax=Hydnomerulius pinastri MD-312 TaxID=994086 RepID=A0A0C9W817_9AGAM|nr:hypothetical protein HYDPIDRAFT_33925 [Hydnomerulius pinastri MD-312]